MLLLAPALGAGHAPGCPEPWVQPFHPRTAETAGSLHPADADTTATAVEAERLLTA